MRLTSADRNASPISLVAMIDVLMILLVFFMVTSTYLDLDMLPMAGEADDPGPVAVAAGGERPAPLVIRLDAAGRTHLRGAALEGRALSSAIAAELQAAPGRDVVILPSGGADVQSLVAVMDAGVAAGAGRLRVVRLEAR